MIKKIVKIATISLLSIFVNCNISLADLVSIPEERASITILSLSLYWILATVFIGAVLYFLLSIKNKPNKKKLFKTLALISILSYIIVSIFIYLQFVIS